MVLNDFEAHSHVMSISMSDVVQELVDLLGLTLVAAIGGVSETRAVSQWIVHGEFATAARPALRTRACPHDRRRQRGGIGPRVAHGK